GIDSLQRTLPGHDGAGPADALGGGVGRVFEGDGDLLHVFTVRAAQQAFDTAVALVVLVADTEGATARISPHLVTIGGFIAAGVERLVQIAAELLKGCR